MTWKDMEHRLSAARSHLTHGGPLDQSANVSTVASGRMAHMAHGANNSKNFQNNKKRLEDWRTEDLVQVSQCFQGDNLAIPAHGQLGRQLSSKCWTSIE